MNATWEPMANPAECVKYLRDLADSIEKDANLQAFVVTVYPVDQVFRSSAKSFGSTGAACLAVGALSRHIDCCEDPECRMSRLRETIQTALARDFNGRPENKN